MNDRILRASVAPPVALHADGVGDVRLLPPSALSLRSALRLQDLRLHRELQEVWALRESVWLVTAADERAWQWSDAELASVYGVWQSLAAERPAPTPGASRDRIGGSGDKPDEPFTMLLADLMHCYGGSAVDWLECPAGLAVELGFEISRVRANDSRDDLNVGIAAGGRMTRNDFAQYTRALKRIADAGVTRRPLDPETNLRNAAMMGLTVIRTEVP